MKESVKKQISDRFAIIATICHTPTTFKSSHIRVTEFPETSRTQAEVSTSGHQLKVNPKHFPSSEVEERLSIYIHEAAHLGLYEAHHKPKFWEQLSSILNSIVTSETNKNIISSLFEDEIDWHKVRYRSIQSVNEQNVDRRMETVIERQRKLAKSIDGYSESTALFFDLKRYSWDSGDPNTMFFKDDYSESIQLNETSASASDYTDRELRDFVSEYGTIVDDNHITFEAPVSYENGDSYKFIDNDYAYKMIAFCDRRGMDYCPSTKVDAIIDGVRKMDLTEKQKRLINRLE